ncbi:unnamed protein product, partial [Closterium sp. NIES-54]
WMEALLPFQQSCPFLPISPLPLPFITKPSIRISITSHLLSPVSLSLPSTLSPLNPHSMSTLPSPLPLSSPSPWYPIQWVKAGSPMASKLPLHSPHEHLDQLSSATSSFTLKPPATRTDHSSLPDDNDSTGGESYPLLTVPDSSSNGSRLGNSSGGSGRFGNKSSSSSGGGGGGSGGGVMSRKGSCESFSDTVGSPLKATSFTSTPASHSTVGRASEWEGSPRERGAAALMQGGTGSSTGGSSSAAGSGLTAINNLAQVAESLGSASVGALVALVSIWNFLGRMAAGYVSEQCLKRWCTPRPLCMLLVQAAMGCAHLLFSIGGECHAMS